MFTPRIFYVAARFVLVLGIFGLSFTCAAEKPGNGSLRPFYIIGHGANTLPLAQELISAGANGLEMDVNVLAGSDTLCIGHGPDLGTGAAGRHHAVPLGEFLRGLHEIARTNRQLCLIYFDCKTLAATPEHGTGLLDNIRTNLVGSGTDRVDLITIISVGKLREKAMFDDIATRVGPREALMVDGCSDPVAVSQFFTQSGVTNQAFSDGIVPVNSFMSQFAVAPAVRKACRLRDEGHQIRFVATWSVNNPWWMARYIGMGVDGIVADRGPVWYNFCWTNWGHGLRSLAKIVNKKGARLGIRLATREDNPF